MTMMKIVTSLLLLAGLAEVVIAPTRNLRGIRKPMSRKLATTDIVYAVLLVPEDGSRDTQDCIDTVSSLIEQEFDLHIVHENDPLMYDSVVIDGSTDCDEAFIDENFDKALIRLGDNEGLTFLCLDMLLDKLEDKVEDEDDDDEVQAVVALTTLEVGDCDEEDIEYYIGEVDNSLEQGDMYYNLVENLLDYYGFDDEPDEEDDADYYWWYTESWRSRRGKHRSRHHHRHDKHSWYHDHDDHYDHDHHHHRSHGSSEDDEDSTTTAATTAATAASVTTTKAAKERGITTDTAATGQSVSTTGATAASVTTTEPATNQQATTSKLNNLL